MVCAQQNSTSHARRTTNLCLAANLARVGTFVKYFTGLTICAVKNLHLILPQADLRVNLVYKIKYNLYGDE